MPSRRNRTHPLFLAFSFAAAFVALLLPGGASAQCLGGSVMDFQNIALQGGNPFRAEYSINITPPPLAGLASPLLHSMRMVARDSQGRVRIERSAGKYKVTGPDGAETETERLLISICDPVAQNSIQLDTANKTATVQGPRFTMPSGLNMPRFIPGKGQQQQSFCARLFAMRERMPGTKTEDLGHQVISGLDAAGLRIWHNSPLAQDGEAKPASSYTEMWCSDELGAVLLQSLVTATASSSRRHDTSLQQIERAEPDASLFQIPADFTVLQREEPTRAPFLRPVPAPGATAKPQ